VTVPANGTPAPDFSAPNQHGESITLSALRGNPVVIIFYPWAFSGICRRELAELRDHANELDVLRAHVLALSCDAMFTLRAFADQEGIGFSLLSDHWPHGAIARSYGVFDDERGCPIRGTFVISPGGMIAWQVVNSIGEARQLGDLLKSLST
jgi:mycoredoxin-dependent peroxiredoxin